MAPRIDYVIGYMMIGSFDYRVIGPLKTFPLSVVNGFRLSLSHHQLLRTTDQG
jgi:hypothetical protein